LRLVLAQVAIAAVLALGLPFIVDRTIHDIGDDLTQRFLSGEAAQYLAAAQTGAVPPTGTKAGAIAVYLAQGDHLRRLAGPDIPDLAAVSPARLAREGFFHGPHSDFLTRPIGAGQTLVVAEDRRHPAVLLDDIIAYFFDRFVVIVPMALVCSTLASLWVLARAIKPIRQAASEARALDPIRPGKARLREDRIPTEIEPLVHTANELLDRAVSGYERERVFAATVVHELRTALSTISLRTELLPGGEPREKVVEAVAHASEVVTQMLGLHGREEELLRGRPQPVSAVARDVIDDLDGLIRSSGHGEITVRIIENGPARLAPDALVRITVANIVENALRHTPAGAEIAIICNDAAATITVADSGPGIRMRSGSDGRKIYSRADGSPSRSSGLGIAIVTRLIETAGGSIAFGTSENGGAAVTLSYPAVQDRG
jgi:signal transduction histidine kinase